MTKLHQIYFVRRADGLIKVGTTTDFRTRLASLAKGHGPLYVLRLINGGPKRERSLHQLFRHYHEYGEWFRSERGILERRIGLLDEGEPVPVGAVEARDEWEAGEAEMMMAVRRKVDTMIRARMDRASLKREAAQKAITADHGFSRWFLEHIRNGKASTISAYGYQRLSDAYMIELRAALAFFQGEVDRLTADDHRELLAIAAKIDALRAEFDQRKAARA